MLSYELSGEKIAVPDFAMNDWIQALRRRLVRPFFMVLTLLSAIAYPWNDDSQESKIFRQLHDKQLLIVNSRCRNGLILYKRYHAEFAGPGAAVGGLIDLDCQRVLPVGNLSLLKPESTEEWERAYLIRRQWIGLISQITDNPTPLQQIQKIINQFEGFFGADTVTQLPDEAFALLVGVLPCTVRKVRNSGDRAE